MARRTKAESAASKRAIADQRRRAAARRTKIRNGILVAVGTLGIFAALVILRPEPLSGDTSAEAWDLPALAGDGRVKLSDFRGKPTVAAFFASWCDVCEREIPEFLAVSEQVGDQVQFVGINTQDGGRGIGDARKWGIEGAWPLARDIGRSNGSGLSSGTFGMFGSPMTVFYDAEGIVIHVQRGGMSGGQLVGALQQFYGIGG